MDLRLCGGGGGIDPQTLMKEETAKAMEMAVAAGGSIKQVIVKDGYYDGSWKADKMVMFNLQLFNAATFESLGIPVPPTPVTASTYAQHGYPFFNLEEEASGIAGDFELDTVGELDKAAKQNQALHKAEEGLTFPNVKIGSGLADKESIKEGEDPDISLTPQTSSLNTTPSPIKLNFVDQKSVFLPIRLLEIDCQKDKKTGKGKGKRSFSED